MATMLALLVIAGLVAQYMNDSPVTLSSFEYLCALVGHVAGVKGFHLHTLLYKVIILIE